MKKTIPILAFGVILALCVVGYIMAHRHYFIPVLPGLRLVPSEYDDEMAFCGDWGRIQTNDISIEKSISMACISLTLLVS